MNEITIYGEIGMFGVNAETIRAQISGMDTDLPLTVRIDSPGGSVFEGFSIFNALKDYPGPVNAIIESAAFSIASYIMLAADTIEIADNGFVMIHNPATGSGGDSSEHQKQAALLDKLEAAMIKAYVDATGKPEEAIRTLMANETYYDAEEAVEAGLATSISALGSVKSIVACNSHLPQRVFASLSCAASGAPPIPSPVHKEQDMTKQPVAASVAEIKAIYADASSDFIVKAIEAEMTTEAVSAEMVADLQTQLAEASAMIEALLTSESEAVAKAKELTEADEAKATEAADEAKAAADLAAAAKGNPGIPNAGTGAETPSATARWNEAIRAHVAEGCDRAKAVKKANRLNPGLRAEYLAEVNA